MLVHMELEPQPTGEGFGALIALEPFAVTRRLDKGRRAGHLQREIYTSLVCISNWFRLYNFIQNGIKHYINCDKIFQWKNMYKRVELVSEVERHLASVRTFSVMYTHT